MFHLLYEGEPSIACKYIGADYDVGSPFPDLPPLVSTSNCLEKSIGAQQASEMLWKFLVTRCMGLMSKTNIFKKFSGLAMPLIKYFVLF